MSGKISTLLIWKDKTGRIARIIEPLEKLKECLQEYHETKQVEFREVSCMGLLKEHFSIDLLECGWGYIKEELEYAEGAFFRDILPIRYFCPTREYPCFLTSDSMSGGVVISPVIYLEDSKKGGERESEK